MGVLKKIQRWFRDPLKSSVRRPVNQRSSGPILNTQTVTASTTRLQEQRSQGKPVAERDDIAQCMKEMVNRSRDLRNGINLANPEKLSVYQERVATRLSKVPTKNSRINSRHN